MGGDNGKIVAAGGALPMLISIFNVCVDELLLGAPISGSKASQGVAICTGKVPEPILLFTVVG